MKTRLSRRHVLRGIGGVALSLPLLEAMEASAAAAPGLDIMTAGGRRPKRFMTLFVPNGTLEKEWYPTGDETNFTLGPIMQGTDPANGRKSLVPHKSDLVIFKGLDNKATQTGLTCTHNDIATVTTGWPLRGDKIGTATTGGPSIDQFIGRMIDKAAPLKATSVAIGTWAGNNNKNGPSWSSHVAANQPAPRFGQAADLFKQIFGGGNDPMVGQLWARRKSVLDGALADYQRTLGKVSGDDRQRLQAHLDSLRLVEKRLASTVTCGAAAPTFGKYEMGTYGPMYGPSTPDVVKDFIEVLVLALSCDTTRTAAIDVRPAGGGDSYFPWLGLSTVYAQGEHHELTHDPDNAQKRPRLLAIYQWFTEVLATLITRLKETKEADGSLFDTTAILQISECSNGASHSKNGIPFLLAGNMGKSFRTGRFLTLSRRPHNTLLLTVARAMGSDAETFGDPSLNMGVLGDLLA